MAIVASLRHTMNNSYQDQARVKKATHHYERYFALGGDDKELEQTYLTTKDFLDQFANSGK